MTNLANLEAREVDGRVNALELVDKIVGTVTHQTKFNPYYYRRYLTRRTQTLAHPPSYLTIHISFISHQNPIIHSQPKQTRHQRVTKPLCTYSIYPWHSTRPARIIQRSPREREASHQKDPAWAVGPTYQKQKQKLRRKWPAWLANTLIS